MTLSLTWIGHATLAVNIGGYTVVVDPFFADNPTTEATSETVAADYILVSHGHNDHIADAVALSKHTGAPVITTLEVAGWLEKQGVQTHGLNLGGQLSLPFGKVKLTVAVHGSQMPDGSYGGCAVGFLLTSPKGRKIYLACDTALFGDMRLIGEEGVDLAVLPIGDYFTMGPDDALRAVKLLEPKQVMPYHYGTWDLIEQDPDAWAQRVSAETSAQAHVLKPGDTLQLVE